jgi:hypothetical protein
MNSEPKPMDPEALYHLRDALAQDRSAISHDFVQALLDDRDHQAAKVEAAERELAAINKMGKELAVVLGEDDPHHPLDLLADCVMLELRQVRAEVARLRSRARVEAEDVERAGVTWRHVEAWLRDKGWTTPRVDAYGWVTSWASLNLEQHDLARADRSEAERVAQAVDYLSDALTPSRPGFDIVEEMAAIELAEVGHPREPEL